MNNKDLILELSARLNKSQKDISQLLELSTKALISELTAQKIIGIHNFGTFEVKKTNDRVIVNPSTQQKMFIPAKLKLVFKVANTYKEKIKNLANRG